MSPNPIVQGILDSFADRSAPWDEVQASLQNHLQGGDVYLGGDGLRPYSCWVEGENVYIQGVHATSVPQPPLIREILAGDYSPPVVAPSGRKGFSLHLRKTVSLEQRLTIPRLLLIGLGDAERYRGARLALGIARLSQWLRFSHSARVTVVDYNLIEDPLEYVRDLLDAERYDIVGVSVNFGQWQMLEELGKVVSAHAPRVIVLGNILAAFSPDRAASVFRASASDSVFVATSLGERPLEKLCRKFQQPNPGLDIAGLILPSRVSGSSAVAPRRPEPPELVYPDDSLMLQIAKRGGQIALETSFGCQYGACTFCPRDHRGTGWERGHDATVVATLERLAPLGAVLSIVDEEFFGAEGLADPPPPNLSPESILKACRELGISYEIYTRLEQIFDRRRSREWNLARTKLLATEAEHMRRLFVGVESGSPTQLRRYGKGQTVSQTEDALRVGSLLGVPMEFGFITFDPLLTPEELIENIVFLGRRDVMACPAEAKVKAVMEYLDSHTFKPSGAPLFRHVAYMATELEVLARSRYADHLRRRHPDLLDGDYDPSFARYGVRYREERIGQLADWSRVWTEGMFTPVYEARMSARASGDVALAQAALHLVTRYRIATFTLLVNLTAHLLPEVAPNLEPLLADYGTLSGDSPEEWFDELAHRTLREGQMPLFDIGLRDRRRQR